MGLDPGVESCCGYTVAAGGWVDENFAVNERCLCMCVRKRMLREKQSLFAVQAFNHIEYFRNTAILQIKSKTSLRSPCSLVTFWLSCNLSSRSYYIGGYSVGRLTVSTAQVVCLQIRKYCGHVADARVMRMVI